ncbi:Bardet-Biedl syndrome 1 protein [Camarhynchus parvulus]|uniref:Bardet-Biedl syndrome 1 protein n=1 Tax=Geospiza parvula TaxID=87175 RepID=UPI0012381DE2|nr:Bardet-Biedl syndrome 1 protein [Camarhynchus parvulus]
MAAAEESASLWLEAHEDPLAGLCSFPGCMALVDLHGDGDHKLVVGVPRGPGGPRLAVVRGAGSMRSLALPEAPAGWGRSARPSGGRAAPGRGGPRWSWPRAPRCSCTGTCGRSSNSRCRPAPPSPSSGTCGCRPSRIRSTPSR